MDSNNLPRRQSAGLSAFAAASLAVLLVSGCTVMKDRESPINEVTKGSPTVLDIYRGNEYRNELARQDKISPQDRMREKTNARPVNEGDELTQRYWSAVEPMNQRFARVPNPDLVMVVYPHLAKGQYPVPGYVTVFPMYDQTFYALPGEVPEDLIQGRALYQGGQQRPEPKAAAPRGVAGEQPVAGYLNGHMN